MLADKGYEFELTLVGDGVDRQALETLGRQLGICDRLVFAGYVGQDVVLEYLQRSDVFILPSFAEGVPVSLMEAMACDTNTFTASTSEVRFVSSLAGVNFSTQAKDWTEIFAARRVRRSLATRSDAQI